NLLGTMFALILAGGEGSRLKLGEKALVSVAGRPMLSWVIDAFTGAGIEPVVVTSHKTPSTRNFCRSHSIDTINTAGIGYVEDLQEAVEFSKEGGALFTSAVDIPYLTADIVANVRDAYFASGKQACSTWVPISLCERYGMRPRYCQKISGVEATPCALNIFLGSLLTDIQDELTLLLHEPRLVFNVNTREELKVAELAFKNLKL
ncbi:MAG TPA: NTP transferase domain-containing protein, partial [Methanocorpusculum sp.]|nr:NTP transferase domain-containing protein [Methanocorpusculum sp.]